MNETKLWEKCGDFHGHMCPGLAIGFKASLYAMKLLDLTFSQDEDVVCITENDACGVDAVQVVLGCSAGKGNLLFKLRGKMVFSFYNRKNGKSVRLVLRQFPKMSKEETMNYYISHDSKELFDVKETVDVLPIRAKIFNSLPCDLCGEVTMDSMLRLEGEKRLCLDCFIPYSRFLD